ncbi:MAG: prolipoprotein diacylglyceryl transferase [Alphaproteobacteria bacterium]|nr:prolipoprotein diacylglyceryl transferase [Alphaproteobacteria bacterium]
MPVSALVFPEIDPVLIEIGPLAIRWYALSYIAALLFGWWYLRYLLSLDRLWPTRHLDALPRVGFKGRYTEAERKRHGVAPPVQPLQVDDFLVWVTLGVIIGGRLGSILFYDLLYCGLAGDGHGLCGAGRGPDIYLEAPWRIFAVWQGGMSFHGGLIGVILALVLFARRNGIDLVRLGDLLAVATPVGIALVRCANFINAELWGKVTTAPWGVIFCNEVVRRTHGGGCPAGLEPRHPVQLYEAATEGLLLFAVLFYLTHRTPLLRRPGLAIGVFLTGYSLARTFSEFFKDSGTNILGPFTMGMLLSIPMWAAGAFFLWYGLRARPDAAARDPSSARARQP